MAYAKGQLVDILHALHVPTSQQNLTFFRDWAQAEGGSATYNPFNTTQGANGATDYNSVHVRNYVNRQQGTNATVQTLQNGLYGDILKGLRQNNAVGAARGLAASKWGTGDLVLKMLNAGTVPSGPPGTPPQTNPGANPAPQGPSMSGRATLLQSVMDRNNQYALTGSLDPAAAASYKLSVAQNGLTPQDQKQMGNIAPPKGATTGMAHGAGALIQTAQKFIGTPYVWGGSTPKGFDCSGLIQYVYAQHGISLGRTTYQQITQGKAVKGWGNFQPGDIIFSNWGGGHTPEHEVMYIGNGKVIAAPHTGTKVQIQDVSIFKDHYVGARRIL